MCRRIIHFDQFERSAVPWKFRAEDASTEDVLKSLFGRFVSLGGRRLERWAIVASSRNGDASTVLYAAITDGAGITSAHIIRGRKLGETVYVTPLHESQDPDEVQQIIDFDGVPRALLGDLSWTDNHASNLWRERARAVIDEGMNEAVSAAFRSGE